MLGLRSLVVGVGGRLVWGPILGRTRHLVLWLGHPGAPLVADRPPGDGHRFAHLITG